MTTTLWGSGDAPLDPRVLAYTAGEDRALDQRLLPWDVVGSLGHIESLRRAKLLTPREHERLRAALRRALRLVQEGALTVEAGDEDAHSALEKHLVQTLGPLGEKVHTGRSRNDQVICALRLLAKDRLLAIAHAALDAAEALAGWGARHARVVFPGYTHQRRAMPSTIGLWAGGFAEALLDDLGPLDAVFALTDRSPLGSAAGYGVPLPLDRGAAARALGFASVQRNVTAVQASRGKLEAQTIAALWGFAFDLGKLSWDAILFSSEEFGFFTLPPVLATGSSIMPQKRNPDVFEMTRARAASLDGLLVEAMALAGGLPSGYHRDLQATKGSFLRALDLLDEMLRMIAFAVPALGVDEARCAAALSPELFATDEALRRVREGASFRGAYREVAKELAAGELPPVLRAKDVLAARTHEGGAGNPGLRELAREIARARARVRARRRRFDAVLDRLTRPRRGTGARREARS